MDSWKSSHMTAGIEPVLSVKVTVRNCPPCRRSRTCNEERTKYEVTTALSKRGASAIKKSFIATRIRCLAKQRCEAKASHLCNHQNRFWWLASFAAAEPVPAAAQAPDSAGSVQVSSPEGSPQGRDSPSEPGAAGVGEEPRACSASAPSQPLSP